MVVNLLRIWVVSLTGFCNFADICAKRGLKILPYTANTIKEFEFLVNLGVDGIITNEIELLNQ